MKFEIKYSTLFMRLNFYNYSVEKALFNKRLLKLKDKNYEEKRIRKTGK